MEIRFKKKVPVATDQAQPLNRHQHLNQCHVISQKKFFLKTELQVQMSSRSVLLKTLLENQNLANNLASKNSRLENSRVIMLKEMTMNTSTSLMSLMNFSDRLMPFPQMKMRSFLSFKTKIVIMWRYVKL